MKLEVTSPYDLSPVGELDYTPNEQVEGILETAAAAAQEPLKKSERIAILEKVIELAQSRVDELAMTIAQEGGKPLVDALVEVNRGIQGIRCAIETLNVMAGKEIPMGLNAASEQRLAFTTLEPIGVVVAVSAFNHPFNLIVHQVIPGIATGCPVIVKPALTTPLSCQKLVGMLHEAGLPERYCQMAIVDNDGSEILVTDSRVNFFSFIGSARVGWFLRSKLAPGVRCALEHGGAAPVIVAGDAPISDIVGPLVKGGFYHAGQVCVSVQRIFVDNSLKDELVGALTKATNALIVGDPTKSETEVGPLILPREIDRVANWVEEAKTGGAITASGGEKISETCYQPTVLVDPPSESLVSTSEIFGPVICVYGYDSMDEAIGRANSLPVAFQASVFAQDIDKALYATRRLAAATVMINDHTAFRVDWMPFAGRRTSGLGIGGIPFTMEDMVQEKQIILKSPSL